MFKFLFIMISLIFSVYMYYTESLLKEYDTMDRAISVLIHTCTSSKVNPEENAPYK